MEQIRIKGGHPLHGAIEISGAKNAALPLMTASLLTRAPLRLTNMPDLVDIATLAHLLRQFGVAIDTDPSGPDRGAMTLTAETIASTIAPYDLVRRMRASILVLGPLIARCGEAHVSLPGGCAIGTRPVDLHLKGLEQMGARIELEDGYIHAAAPAGLKGASIRFPFVSVGATENLLMAAALARGETVLENAAREPEVADLANCLIAMGARIVGVGSERLVIEGVAELHGAAHSVIADRIETGTYAIASAVTGGDVRLVGARMESLGAVLDTLRQCGVKVEGSATGVRVFRHDNRIRSVDVTTQPYPGFPTDMQAQMMALLATADGASVVTESIFENRFMHVPELTRMGANIALQGPTAVVRGVQRLRGAPVMATDLRASVSLVLAGLAASGETTVSRIYHLDRGYERLVEKLSGAGADIERVAA